MSGVHFRPPPRGLVAPAALVLLGLAGVWWAYPEELSGWRAIAIITAWAGSGLLVGSLALMVREPRWSALMGGLDTMYRWHHRAGVAAYVSLLAHPLALAMAGWLESPETAWRSLAPWAQSWPVWLGWLGLLLLMTGLAATFERRLSYRRWRAFHLLLAAGVVCGLAHIFVLLGEAGLLLLFMLLAVAALVWRLLVSDLGLAAHPYRVTAVVRRADGMIEASLAPHAGAVAVAPGQFVLAAFGDGPTYRGCGEFHPFSVSGVGPDGAMSVSIKALGPCTRRIQNMEPGVQVRLQGPFGSFLAGESRAPQLWIAGGVGITPFIAALRQGAVSQPTTLIYLFRTEQDAAFLDELQTHARSDARFELLTEASGQSLPDFDGLLSRVARIGERQVYICGPAGLLQAVTARLRRLGLPSASIHFERFDFR